MRVGYIGNFDPEHSTENHVRKALLNNGHDVRTFQENNLDAWDEIVSEIPDLDFILWTRTGWQPPIPHDKQHRVLAAARDLGKPTVSYHLDRWWGLRRQVEVQTEPFFRTALVVTADGGHPGDWAALGVNHHWFPPGVSRDECERLRRPCPEYDHEVVFCGSWDSYHPEWQYRLHLVEFLRETYGARLALYPQPGQHALRGQPLVDLYRNCQVIVGDSCLAGDATAYWSDRVPETLGRGGFLIHPKVEGMDEHFTRGLHFAGYPLGDFGELKNVIEHYLTHPDERIAIAKQGQEHVLRHHTYERRMEQLVELMQSEGML